VTFDPFGDFETQGYLRNLANEKDAGILRPIEFLSFVAGIDAALERLTRVELVPYPDVLETHRLLFDFIYPWAGQDRLIIAPDLAVAKGPLLFARPRDIRPAVEFALRHAQDTKFMAAKPGEIMGYLAYGHPFLDGNWRTMMPIHAVLAQRAGFRIDWAATVKLDYESVLMQELDDPGNSHLDRYLSRFMRDAVANDQLANEIVRASYPEGNDDEDAVLGKITDPAVQARYEQQDLKRRRD
jgi:cell filamentation protein